MQQWVSWLDGVSWLFCFKRARLSVNGNATPQNLTWAGEPKRKTRPFPHLIKSGQWVFYHYTSARWLPLTAGSAGDYTILRRMKH